jgi:hypothetical protein
MDTATLLESLSVLLEMLGKRRNNNLLQGLLIEVEIEPLTLNTGGGQGLVDEVFNRKGATVRDKDTSDEYEARFVLRREGAKSDCHRKLGCANFDQRRPDFLSSIDPSMPLMPLRRRPLLHPKGVCDFQKT